MERSSVFIGEKRKEREEDLGLGTRIYQPISYKSPTSMGIAMRMFPFTTAQWQELQRQALIYKHFMASVPVPPDFLFPSAANSFPQTPTILLPSTVVGRGGGIDLRFTNNMDPELGRCRRTDGKKWRCARDVAPDQKYCERHLHRSRPRSRKPVEAKLKSNASAAAASAAAANNTNNGTLDAVPMLQTGKSSATASSGFVPNIELNLPFQSEEPRCQDWMRSYSGDLDSNQQWELMHSKIGVKYNSNPVMQNYGHLPNLNYSYYTDDLNSDCCSFLNPNLPSYRDSHLADYREPPKRLIDAWSAENIASASKPMDSVSGRDKLPVSCLTLSMSNGIAEGTDNSPLGGPLAEAFQSTNGNSNCIDLINLMCKSSSSSSSRMVSSPSGVLQKTLVSLSDSSSSSSPTFAAVPRSEFAFEWMKQNK